MNYQAIRAVIEAPLLTVYNSLVPAVPVYFDNIYNETEDSSSEFISVNIQFGVTTEPTLTSSLERAQGIVVVRVYTEKGKGPARNQNLASTAFNVLQNINATPKPATGVYVRTGEITGPTFGMGTPDQQSRRAFTPFFLSRLETSFQAMIL
jgi:hypothetical protein